MAGLRPSVVSEAVSVFILASGTDSEPVLSSTEVDFMEISPFNYFKNYIYFCPRTYRATRSKEAPNIL